jgi:hypothetical protein
LTPMQREIRKTVSAVFSTGHFYNSF